MHGQSDFTKICLPAREQRKEIQMSELAGSVADGIMASKAVEFGQRDSQLHASKLGEILNSYKVSSTAALGEMKKLDWRSSVGAGERPQKQLRCLLERHLHSSKVRGWLHGEGKSNWGAALEESRRQKKWKYKEERETEIASTSQVLQKSEPLILWIQIQRVLEKPPLLPLIFSAFISL